jgi:hypothetical protein
VPEAEGVRHAHITAGVVAVVGQRYWRRSHSRQRCIVC